MLSPLFRVIFRKAYMKFEKEHILSIFLHDIATRLPRNCSKQKLWILAKTLASHDIRTLEDLEKRLKND